MGDVGVLVMVFFSMFLFTKPACSGLSGVAGAIKICFMKKLMSASVSIIRRFSVKISDNNSYIFHSIHNSTLAMRVIEFGRLD